MNELDDNYKMLLNVGFIVLREALQSGSTDWVKAEIEMLHNVPSLIGETNTLRHEYYWEKERTAYVEWIKKFGSEYAQSRMAVFYEPIWESISKEIESLTHKKIGAISAQKIYGLRQLVLAPKETIIQRAPLDWSIVKKATGETRWQHIQKHGVNNLKKDLHGVFDQDAVLTTQEAWYRAQRLGIKMDADGTLVVPMGRRVGYEGGKLGSGAELNSVTIHSTDGCKIITAYPTK